jgi:hypothetical protein
MQKWEYKIVETNKPREMLFNELGAEGWELVVGTFSDTYSGFYIFKRLISS